MPGHMETDTITTQNITSSLLVGSYTAAAAGFVAVRLRLSGLNTSGRQTITMSLVVNDGTNDHPAERASAIKDAAADTRFQRQLGPVWLTAGDVLKVYALSSSASDTSISGSVSFVDAGNPVDAVATSGSDKLGVASAVWTHEIEALLEAGAAVLGLRDESVITNGRLTSARATLLDKLNVTGNLAHSDAAATYRADVSALALEATAQAVKTKTDALPATPAAVGDAMALTSGERSTLAAAIEVALVNEGDATAFLQAVADKLAADLTAGDVTAQAIASATRDALLDRVLSGNHDTAGTVGKVLQDTLAGVDSFDGADTAVLRAVLAGKRSVTDNGDGTKTARCYAPDGVTVKVDLTFNAAGEITTVEVDPA